MFRFAKKTSLLLIAFFCTLFVQKTEAITKFETKYQVYYKVEQSGNTKVTFAISQKNNLSVVYATEYGISLNETKINNLKIVDQDKIISNPTIVKNQNQTVISFPFLNKVVGKNKVHNFIIEYETPDIVTKRGNTWQIDIPRFESSESISEQTAILSLPENFPKPSYIDPKPDIVNNNTYYFSSKTTANKPISLIFGENQYYKAKIDYYLKNSLNISDSKSITLVPNTGYQTVNYTKIEPKPDKIEEDVDGNLLAFYTLKPNQELNITSELFIQTSFTPKQSQSSSLPAHTLNNDLWNFDDVTFTTPELKNLTSPKSIYDFVTNKLKYDYQKINQSGTVRQPASEILKNPQSAICTDFTDLFVSLARKAGIPARELEGIALSDNQDLKPISDKLDLLHAWPEYYDADKKMWIQVDPTWANTTRGSDYFSKLDFNHIVFAIHGVTPLEPIPAGGFKNPKNNQKQIQVEAIEKIDFPYGSLEASAKVTGINQVSIILRNTSGVYFDGSIQVIEDQLLNPETRQVRVPPYGEFSFDVSTKMFSFFDTKTAESIININGKQQSLIIESEQGTSPFLFAAISIILGIVTLTIRSLLLRRRKSHTSLHR